MQKTKIDLSNEAIGLLDFHGGKLPSLISWETKCRPYFVNREIPQDQWKEIFYQAQTLITQS